LLLHLNIISALTSASKSSTLSQDEHHYTPKKASDADNLLGRESTDEPTSGILTEEISGVDHCGDNGLVSSIAVPIYNTHLQKDN
jgi:hypothetical protein